MKPTPILLIEDNPGDADLVREALGGLGDQFSLTVADRLATGLETLKRELPGAVLLDLNLPDSHGSETSRKLLEKAPGVPIIILSGLDDEELAISAVHQGVQDYLLKGDFDSKHLARAIRYAMERQSLLTSLDMSRTQQLEFKNQFLSHVSHELRTPLSCIHQFVTILLDGLAGPLPLEQREHLETVMKSVTQLRAMISDLLEAARVESKKIRLDRRCLALKDLVQQAMSMMKAGAHDKQVGLELGLDTRVGKVYADPDRVLQVLINLLDNAIKFTPADGVVTVRVCLTEADPDFVYLSVADTGCGIASEVKPLIFERLYQDPNTVDNRRKGLGLGLYISKELVHLHGGRIWVESQPGSGSIFTFTLPIFSLAKLLFPLITTQGHLRECLVLLSAELLPLRRVEGQDWRNIRRLVLEILEHCIYYVDKDLILPNLGDASRPEPFYVVASTDLDGADIMLRRIRYQLERCPELATNYSIQLSARNIPVTESCEPLEELVQNVTDRVLQMIAEVRNQPVRDVEIRETATTAR
jgi:signal transduction histidine kinase